MLGEVACLLLLLLWRGGGGGEERGGRGRFGGVGEHVGR